MNVPYLVPRVIRHFLPEGVTQFLLRRSLLIKPGLETSDPLAAVERYTDALRSRHEALTGKRVMVFGYGGRFDVGVGLLEAGAGYVILCDRFALPDEVHNRRLLEDHPLFLIRENGRVIPRPERMLALQADVRSMFPAADMPPMDLVISNSVYEHVDDVEGTTAALAGLTQPGGLQIHFADLRDHFFKYPFEMLRYSERTWRRWLNPTSNHNRYRIWDYQRAFELHFTEVEIEVLDRDEAAFRAARNGIRPEFISGDPRRDSVTLIRIIAAGPRPTSAT